MKFASDFCCFIAVIRHFACTAVYRTVTFLTPRCFWLTDLIAVLPSDVAKHCYTGWKPSHPIAKYSWPHVHQTRCQAAKSVFFFKPTVTKVIITDDKKANEKTAFHSPLSRWLISAWPSLVSSIELLLPHIIPHNKLFIRCTSGAIRRRSGVSAYCGRR